MFDSIPLDIFHSGGENETMIVSKDFLGKVRLYFGLNLYEVRIWTALLSRGVSSAGELSDIANVPRSRSYDILASLEGKGFIVPKEGRPLRYEALAPAEVVGRVSKNLKANARKSAEQFDSFRESESFKQLRYLYDQGSELIEPHEFIGAMRGRENLHHHLRHTIGKAEKSLTLVTTENGLIRKAELLMPIFKELNSRGVKIRIAAPVNKNTASIVKQLSEVAEVRHTNSPARFCLIDGKEVTFMVNDDKDIHPAYDVAIWAQSPFFSETLTNLFELSWANMKPAPK